MLSCKFLRVTVNDHNTGRPAPLVIALVLIRELVEKEARYDQEKQANDQNSDPLGHDF